MKRLVIALLAVVIAASMLAACGKKTDTENTEASVKVTATADEATPDEATADEAEAETETETEKAAEKATEDKEDEEDEDGEEDDDSSSSESSYVSLPDTGEVVTTANVTSGGMIDTSDIFTSRDLTQSADLSDAKYYTLSSGSNISITSAGVYVISGSADNSQIIVEAGDDDKVQIVLNGVNINNSSVPAIYVKSADKVFVTSVSGTESSLSVTGSFSSDGDTNTDAVIFSKEDLVLNGLGSIYISSTDNGVTSKDDLKITGGSITVECTSDAFEANDSIAVADGNITVNCGKDALHSEYDEDNTVGYVYICGGTFNINAGDDGIQATTVAQIDGGNISISACEGIEGTYIQINGGSINISASDDGINASTKSSAYSVRIDINGGDITINMGQGDTDAIDSNGDLYINGGTINISAQSAFDYDGVGVLSGGTVYVNGTQVTELSNQMMGGMQGEMQSGMQQGGSFSQNTGSGMRR